MLNTILHQVGISWIITPNYEMKYEIYKRNHQDWLNKCPWYNTAIYSRLHGSLFEYFITHAGKYRYNIMCYLVTHDKKQLACEDTEISLRDRLVSKNTTTKALEALGANINFIDIWLKLSEDNYEIRYAMYNKTMKEMSKQINITTIKALSPKQKV